ncbi:hypothetical protein ES703_43717 [subsurface metagenome]
MARTNGGNQVHEAEINVEGVVPERQQAAVDEIRWFLKLLSAVTRKSRVDVAVKRVLIAKNFDATINELSSVCKNCRFSG